MYLASDRLNYSSVKTKCQIYFFVIPAKAGIYTNNFMDSRSGRE